MNALGDELRLLAQQYAKSRGISVNFQDRLGFGNDGHVWRTNRGSAVKVLYRQDNFEVERDCYLRLKKLGWTRIGELNVPELVDYDNRLLAIEIGVVEEPYVLDFGKAYIDQPPPYWNDAQLMANFHADKSRLFGKNWKKVSAVLSSLRRIGIYYIDPKPGNISFVDDEGDDWDQFDL